MADEVFDDDPSIELTATLCDVLKLELRKPPPRMKHTLWCVRLAATIVTSELYIDLSTKPGARLARQPFRDSTALLAAIVAEARAAGFRDDEFVIGCHSSLSKVWKSIRDRHGQARVDRLATMLSEAR